MTFRFSFSPAYRLASLPFGITPGSARVDVGDGLLHARFGLWSVKTPLDNVLGAASTGPYGRLRTMGPARLSVADRGLTFATNGRRGLCIRFREPVPGLEPTGRIRHPGLTVTVTDVEALAQALGFPLSEEA
jgi:hypothetical protein